MYKYNAGYVTPNIIYKHISSHHHISQRLFGLQPNTGVAAVAAVADAVGVGATATVASGSPGRAAMVKWGAADGAEAAGISAGTGDAMDGPSYMYARGLFIMDNDNK